MPKLRKPRQGVVLKIKNRPIPFSFWPVCKTIRRFGLQSTLFALDPWNVIVSNIRKSCPSSSKSEAEACVEQAQDFYKASLTATLASARPLLLYYSFMNLAKAYCLTRGSVQTFNQAKHGISEQLGAGARELSDAFLKAFPSPCQSGGCQIFDEFSFALSGNHIASPNHSFGLPQLLPQVVAGHRLWCDAADKDERFIAIEHISVVHKDSSKECWLNLYIYADDLERFGIAHKEFLLSSRLDGDFREVECKSPVPRKLIRFEQVKPMPYTGRPADILQKLVDTLRGKIWSTVSSGQPYRRYYAYLAPVAEHADILPQLASIYAVIFYLGSITRYRPHHFDLILEGDYGAWIREFIIGQPVQFVYLLASEFAQQEVTRPAIV